MTTTIDQLEAQYNDLSTKVHAVKVRMYHMQRVSLTVSIYRANIRKNNPLLGKYRQLARQMGQTWKQLDEARFQAWEEKMDLAVAPETNDADWWSTPEELATIDAWQLAQANEPEIDIIEVQ